MVELGHAPATVRNRRIYISRRTPMTIIWKHLVASTLRRARVALAPIQSMNDRRRSLLVAGALVLAGLTLPGASTAWAQLGSGQPSSGREWVGTWATSPQIQMPNTVPTQFPAQTT